MNHTKKIVILWITTLLSVILLGYFFGAISFEQKTVTKAFVPTIQLSGIEQISGSFFSSPGSLNNEIFLFKQAKYNIYGEIYEFTEKNIKKLFKQLLEDDVKINIIMENKKYKQFQNTYNQIQNYFSGYSNFHIQSDDRMKTSYVHSKFMLIDSGFIIQTANLTHSSFNTNREYFFYSTHSGVYKSLATIFEKDWQGSTINYDDIHPNLLVCPINCRSVLEYLLSGAKESIYIQNQYIDDPNLQKLIDQKIILIGKKNIHIQLPISDKNKLLTKRWGSSVISLIKKPYIHAKMMLIDKKILYLGSINFSTNSMDNNRELGILLTDSSVIKQFLTIFKQTK